MIGIAMRDHNGGAMNGTVVKHMRIGGREVAPKVRFFPAVDEDHLAFGRFDDRAVALTDIYEADFEQRFSAKLNPFRKEALVDRFVESIRARIPLSSREPDHILPRLLPDDRDSVTPEKRRD